MGTVLRRGRLGGGAARRGERPRRRYSKLGRRAGLRRARAPFDDADLVVAGLSTGTIAMWELRGAGTSLALAVAPHAAGVSALAARRAGSDGVLIVSGGDDAKIATVAVRRSSARVEVVALGGCAPVRGLAFTRDGRVCVAARGDGVVSAWRVAEDSILRVVG